MKLYVVVVVVVVVVLVDAVEVALVVAEVVVVIVLDPTSKHFVGIIVQFVLRKNYGVLSCEVVLYRHRQSSVKKLRFFKMVPFVILILCTD